MPWLGVLVCFNLLLFNTLLQELEVRLAKKLEKLTCLWCSLPVDSAPLLWRGDGRVTRRVGPCLRPGVDY